MLQSIFLSILHVKLIRIYTENMICCRNPEFAKTPSAFYQEGNINLVKVQTLVEARVIEWREEQGITVLAQNDS